MATSSILDTTGRHRGLESHGNNRQAKHTLPRLLALPSEASQVTTSLFCLTEQNESFALCLTKQFLVSISETSSPILFV